MKKQTPHLVGLLWIAVVCAFFSSPPLLAQEIESRHVNVQYSQDGTSAKLQTYNNTFFSMVTANFLDASGKAVAKLSVGPKQWSAWTDSITLPCTIEVVAQSGGRWTRTVEPRDGAGSGSQAQGQPSGTRKPSVGLLEDKPAPYDRILLKNGDMISGMVRNETFSIKTSYASLQFPPDKLASIELEGAGANLDQIVLSVGDKMSGVLETAKIKVQLTAGGDAEIDKDKIKAIRFREKKTN